MEPTMGSWRRVLVVALVAAILVPAVLSACPLCKEEVPAQGGGGGLWRGMFWSILLMMSAPFATVGTVTLLILRKRRRQPPRESQP